MSNLRAYLTGNSLTQADFAALIDVKQATVSRLVNGVQRPSLDLALKIQSATRDAIPVDAWASGNGEGSAA